MPVSYDFKSASRNTPVRRGAGWKRLRFLGVLCVVAAITVGVIMIIVPERKEPAGKENTGNNGSVENISAPQSGSGDVGGKTGNSSVSADNRSTKSQNESPDSDQPGKNTGNDQEVVDKLNSAGNGSSSKSAVTPDDLPLSEDQPAFSAGQAPGAAEALAKAAAQNDPDKSAEILRAFLMKEYSAGGEFSENWNAVGSELASAIRTKWQKRSWQKESVVHKVVARDHFIKISRRYDTTVEAIRFINNRKGNIIRIGDRLTVIPGPWKLTVSKKARLLNVWRKVKDSWQIFAVFPIGVGRKNSTPEGAFIVNIRLRHPKWHGPDGRVFAYGDRENPLGDYFLKLRNLPGKVDKGYGIHGSADDKSVGRSLSNGCIRMRNSDVEVLYYLLPVSTPVKIMD